MRWKTAHRRSRHRFPNHACYLLWKLFIKGSSFDGVFYRTRWSKRLN